MNKKIGLALGGGGARGLAHIGVLKVFEREQIPLYSITGCSIGAIVGGAYALFGDAKRVEDLAFEHISSSFFKAIDISAFSAIEEQKYHNSRFDHLLTYLKIRLSLLKTLNHPAIYDEKIFHQLFAPFDGILIENLSLKFSAIATDLITGEEFVLSKGDLKNAIMASSAIPGIFPPVKRDELLLIDGSSSDTVPVQAVKQQGADYVIAVDVTKCVRKIGPLTNAILILYRADEIAHFHLTRERLRDAEMVIRPAVRQFSWAHFERIHKIIREGELAAEKMLPKIEKLLRN